jgi:proteasome assembly chaperone (PAC2) family protein
MTDNVQSAIFEILKKIQAELADVKARIEKVEKRTESTDDIVRKMRRDNAGMRVMMRTAAGHFEERIGDLEIKMERVLAGGR